MRAGLRSRLLVLVAVAVLPGLGLLLRAMYQQERDARDDLQDEVVRLAHLLAEQQERTAESAAGVLTGLSRLPVLAPDGDLARCTPALSATVAELPQFSSIGIADPQGRLVCTAFPLPAPISVASRLHFQRAVSRRTFSAGEYVLSHITRRGSLFFARPVLSPRGEVAAVLTIGADVAGIQERLRAAPLPAGARAVIADAYGVVLAQLPQGGAGAPWGSPLRPALLAAAGPRERRDDDGVSRLYAFAAARAGGQTAMLVAVGIPTEPAAGAGGSGLRGTLLALAALAALAFVVAYAMGEFLLVRRLDRIVRAARRLSAGDLGARAGPSSDGTEIGELARTFDEMARSVEQLSRQNRLILDSAGEGILGLDRRQRVTFANATAVRELGRPEAELRNRPLRELLQAERPGEDDESITLTMLRATAHHVNATLVRADGRRAPVECVATPIRDGGAVVGAVVAFRDVSDRRRLEEQLRHAQKMEAVGQLSAGVAHEINNPLAYIASNVAFALEQLAAAPAPAEVTRALQDAAEGAERVRAIVRDLKMFSRQDEARDERVDVREVIRSSVNLAQNEIKHRARLALDLRDVPDVLGCAQRLGQVFLNLLINAAQAIPEGHAEGNEIRVTCDSAEDGRVRVEVSDTGAGIPPDVLPRIFEPFFTTKPVGVGTGLGLSVCHGIVAAMGGSIDVTSARGCGSRFTVWLRPAGPAAAAPPAPIPARPAPGAAPGGRPGRVLLVDDEENVVRALARVLRSHGHEVVGVTSADDALALLRRDGGFDVVLCDLMMPEVTGMELFEQVARDAPQLAPRLVFMTGGAFTPDAQAFLDRVPNLRIEKPMDPDALRDLVADALRSRDRAGPAVA